jgi:hypothetical protein
VDVAQVRISSNHRLKPALGAAVLAAGLALANAAQAGMCDARFLHDGGVLQLKGSGNLQLGADLTFSEVSKSDPNNCRARVTGTSTFSYAGFPPSKSKLDYLMTIHNGMSSFVKYASAGEAPAKTGQFDPRMLGLFAYDGSSLKAGQKLPGSTFRLNIGKEAPVGGQPSTVVHIGQKTVGQRKTIATALGQQACWPIEYPRNSDPTMATFGNLTLPIPGFQTTVTDWFCPSVDMVMKQDIDQSGVKSAVEITQVK